MFDLSAPLSSPTHQKFSIFVILPTQLSGKVEEIVVRADGFDIEGSNTRIVRVESEEVRERFVLTPRQPGEREVQVHLYQNDTNIAQQKANIKIDGELASTTDLSARTIVEIPWEILTDRDEHLTEDYLEIRVEYVQNPPKLIFSLYSRSLNYCHRRIGEKPLILSPEEKMNSIYQKLGHFAKFARKMVPNSNSVDVVNNLQNSQETMSSVGQNLWDELIPDDLKQEYNRFKSVVRSILIISDEPWIPWELIKPYTFNQDGIAEVDRFWCEQFAMSRWLAGHGPTNDLSIGLIVPVSPQNTDLENAKLEVEFVKNLHHLCPGMSGIEPVHTVSETRGYIEEADFAILHFACHGMFDSTLPDDSAINLTDGRLSPADIRRRFINTRPIVFINACSSSRSSFSFTRMGGWSKKFVECQVGVFIGAMWEVSDELASQFATAFYTALLQEKLTIGEAFQRSRLTIREAAPNNSTWLAYSLYATPDAKIR